MAFASFPIDPALKSAVAGLNFTLATEVQRQTIPAMLAGVDGHVQAPTGSGKTLAYTMPLFQHWCEGRLQRGGALVLVPTRELAAQVAAVMHGLVSAMRAQQARAPKTAAVFGGVSINPQMLRLRGGVDILVATPGRLLDLMAKNAVQLDGLTHLIVDEADRFLDGSFADEFMQVITSLKTKPQTWLLSATSSPALLAFKSTHLQRPTDVALAENTNRQPAITQRAIQLNTDQRTSALRQLISSNGWSQVLVFVASKYNAEHLADKLYSKKIYATPFHGGLTQGQRTERLQEFKDGRWDVLITTDLAARGIDIANLPAVVNYDLPRSPADYTHRIGRTARGGQVGVAVSFVTPETAPHFKLIEKRCNLTIARELLPNFPFTPAVHSAAVTSIAPTDVDAARGGTGGIKGKRPSKKDKARAAAQAKGADR